MQFIDFAPSFGMLDFPHPLLPHDVNVQSIWRRLMVAHEQTCAPCEHQHGQAERYDSPQQFQAEVALDRDGYGSLGEAAVSDCEIENEDENNCRKEAADGNQEDEKRVDACRYRRGLIRQ